MSPRPTRQSTGQARGRHSKEQILQAALRLAVERGYDGTTMADVSAESGLPIGSVYWHFSNKEQLFVALLEHSFQKWNEIYAGPVRLRDKVTRGVIGSTGADPEHYTPEESFLRVAQMMALDKRLGGLGEDSAVRETYLRIRTQMFQVNVQRVRESLSAELAEAFPEMPERFAVLALAIVDGLYVHKNTATDLDFAAMADLASEALEVLIEKYQAKAKDALRV